MKSILFTLFLFISPISIFAQGKTCLSTDEPTDKESALAKKLRNDPKRLFISTMIDELGKHYHDLDKRNNDYMQKFYPNCNPTKGFCSFFALEQFNYFQNGEFGEFDFSKYIETEENESGERIVKARGLNLDHIEEYLEEKYPSYKVEFNKVPSSRMTLAELLNQYIGEIIKDHGLISMLYLEESANHDSYYWHLFNVMKIGSDIYYADQLSLVKGADDFKTITLKRINTVMSKLDTIYIIRLVPKM